MNCFLWALDVIITVFVTQRISHANCEDKSLRTQEKIKVGVTTFINTLIGGAMYYYELDKYFLKKAKFSKKS